VSKARILAVDDQLYFRVFLEDLLSQEGYQVDTAAGGAEALGLLESTPYDLILTDLIMPGMDGTELVERVRERLPDQEILVVTSVADVQTAVEAMKLGATDYLLKPIDKASLLRSVDGVLRQRRIRAEHQQLMAENLEFMGVFSLYERAAALFATLALEPLAERVAEVLTLEAGAQGAVVWVRSATGSLRLAAARGLVHPEKELDEISLASLPPELASLSADGRAFLGLADGAEERPLFVPLVALGELVGLARVTDRLGSEMFSERDRAAVEKVAQFAGIAVGNALRFRELERRSFRDPTTKAYSAAYFDDVVRNEIEKASRFGRTFSLLQIEVAEIQDLRGRLSEVELGRLLEGLAHRVARTLRATDLLAIDAEQRFFVLLPETDALGATVLKRRVLELEPEEATPEGLQLVAGAATFPADGSRGEDLRASLETRAGQHRASAVCRLAAPAEDFAGLTRHLLSEAEVGPAALPEQVARFLLAEVGRRPKDRGLLFMSPGASMSGALRDGLEALRGLSPRTQIVLVGDRHETPGLPVAWASPARTGTQAPFLLYCGAGPAYALLQEPTPGEGDPAFFHTDDRALVEHLAFRLGRELGVAIGT
jgi:DNA-binding response OmpR family regulator/GGDEF domain-containing protein